MKLQHEKARVNVFYTHIGDRIAKRPGPFSSLKRWCLPLPYWILSLFLATPGLFFHRYILQLAFILKLKGRGTASAFRQMTILPMDSVRYFEFDFMWKSLTELELHGRYLDVSSPRMFPLMVLRNYPQLRAVIINPDCKDLEATRELFDACDISERCTFLCEKADALAFAAGSFSLISCISVIEHIPGAGDRQAVAKIWDLLSPGGTLLISVPCANIAAEEFININEYNIPCEDESGYVFGQRFYDDNLLAERIFEITGPPVRVSVYGERELGFFLRNREQKVRDPSYPFWREPFMMGKGARYYKAIQKLPGWGVVAMEFRK